MPRKIIHLDLDAFFCAVEELKNPSLKGKSFAVGGKPYERGVISSCSYAARMKGIKSAMPSAKALKICPELTILPSDYSSYADLSHKVMEKFHAITPLVEQISIDEAFLDVSDLVEPARHIGQLLQSQINSELYLPCSLGIASNKLVAKIATDYGKSSHRTPFPPNSIHEVIPGTESQFLAPLPTIALWGIGPKTASLLANLGIHTIGDIAHYPEKELVRYLGKHAFEIYQHAKGIDDRPVINLHEPKSISQETTFITDITDYGILRETLQKLTARVGYRMRKSHLSGTTIKLKIRWKDFSTLTRQISISTSTDEDKVIFDYALKLLDELWKSPKPVRLIGVGVSNFLNFPHQLLLWENSSGKGKRLQQAVDELKDRFGDRSIQRGSEIQKTRRHDETG